MVLPLGRSTSIVGFCRSWHSYEARAAGMARTVRDRVVVARASQGLSLGRFAVRVDIPDSVRGTVEDEARLWA